MIQFIHNVFEFAKATMKNSNNMEELTLQEDGPIIGRAYIAGWGRGKLITGIYFSVSRLMGL